MSKASLAVEPSTEAFSNFDEILAKNHGISSELYVEFQAIHARRAEETSAGNPEKEAVSGEQKWHIQMKSKANNKLFPQGRNL